MRSWILAGFVLLIAACGKVKDPTPKGTKLIEWDRSAARTHDMSDITKEGPKHPIADAKILEGPKTASYTIVVKDGDGEHFTFDLEYDSARVSYSDGGKDIVKWATTRVVASVAENDSFRLVGSCDNRIAMVLAKPGEETNTMMDCRITGKRPNTMGTEDAITLATTIQLEGSGKLLMNDRNIEIKEK